jgi:hypothetical protein
MKICKYGITLSLLRQEDIEFVSTKLVDTDEQTANSPELEKVKLELKQKTEEMAALKNLYYIIEYKEDKIGLISEKELDWETRSSEIELIIWNETQTEIPVSELAMLCLLENGFNYLGWNAYTTRCADIKMIDMLKKLGFRNDSKAEQDRFELNRHRFETGAAAELAQAKAYLDEKSGEGYLLLESDDYKTGIGQHYESHFLESGIYLHRRGIKGDRMYFR